MRDEPTRVLHVPTGRRGTLQYLTVQGRAVVRLDEGGLSIVRPIGEWQEIEDWENEGGHHSDD